MNMISLWQESLDDVALKGALVLGAALIAGLGLGKVSAARRYPLWMAAVLASLLLPPAAAFLPAWQVLPPMTSVPLNLPPVEPVRVNNPPPAKALPEPQQKSETVKPAVMLKSPVTEKTDSPALPTTHSPFGWVPTLAGIWAAIFGLLTARLLWGGWRLRRLEGQCQEPAEDAADHVFRMMKAASAETGLKKTPRLLLGPADSVPMVWGIFRPCLLLPEGAQHWPQEKLRAVLLHELAHLKRRDPLALWMGQIMLAAHWFNPLAWLTLRRLRADQERACDDTVLRQGIRPSDYAQHLLDLSRHTRLAPGLSLCALAMARSAPVAGRVTAILDGSKRRDTASRPWIMLIVSLGLGAALPLAMLQAALEGPKLRGRILDRNGVVLAETGTDGQRKYPLKSLAAHVTGYAAMPFDPRGGLGIERAAHDSLDLGRDVKLTLDAKVQEIATKALADAGIRRGAVVVVDPRSGEVLAMVSAPKFEEQDILPLKAIVVTDPKFGEILAIGSETKVEKKDITPLTNLAKEEKRAMDPDMALLNRTVLAFEPGETFLVITALAGGLSEIPDDRFECTGSVKYGKITKTCWINRFRRDAQHGTLNLSDALLHNCGCYFYQYGNAVGIDSLLRMSTLLGLDDKSGVELIFDEKAYLPTPDMWNKRQPARSWGESHTASAATGESGARVSPLHLAQVAACVATGKVFKPHFIHQVLEDETVVAEHPIELRTDLRELVKESHLQRVREGMRKSVHDAEGKAQGAQLAGMEVAGKTGTVPIWSGKQDGGRKPDTRGWFMGYAPFDKPTLAIAIMAEGVTSGSDCALIARQIFEETLALNKAGQEGR